jgi:hypothetical protein
MRLRLESEESWPMVAGMRRFTDAIRGTREACALRLARSIYKQLNRVEDQFCYAAA